MQIISIESYIYSEFDGGFVLISRLELTLLFKFSFWNVLRVIEYANFKRAIENADGQTNNEWIIEWINGVHKWIDSKDMDNLLKAGRTYW